VEKNQPNSKLAELIREHGMCAHLEVGGQLFVFRAPTLEEWEDYQDKLVKRTRGVCFRELAQVTCVYPSVDELQKLFERVPAVATRIADAVSDLAGADLELTVKKG